EDDRVGGGFDVPGVFAGGGIDGNVGVAGVEAFDRASVGSVNQAFTLESGSVGVETEVDYRFDGVSGPVGRDGCLDAEPGGGPGSAPRVAGFDGLVGGAEGFLDGYGFPGNVPCGDVA